MEAEVDNLVECIEESLEDSSRKLHILKNFNLFFNRRGRGRGGYRGGYGGRDSGYNNYRGR